MRFENHLQIYTVYCKVTTNTKAKEDKDMYSKKMIAHRENPLERMGTLLITC